MASAPELLDGPAARAVARSAGRGAARTRVAAVPWHGLALVAVATLGALLRVAGVNAPFWRDEALFLHVVRLPSAAEMVEFLRLHESHPPLFYLLARGWAALAGGGDAAMTGLPLLFSLATIPAAYLAGRRLVSPAVGLLAALLVAASPQLVRYSAFVRPYSLLPLLALLSTWCLLAGFRARDAAPWTWPWAGWVLATLAALYTHHWSWLFLAGQAVAVAALVLLRGREGPPPPRAALVAGGAAVVLGYLPWLEALLHQARVAGHAPGLPMALWWPVGHLGRVAFGYPWQAGGLLLLIVAGLAFGAARRAPAARFADAGRARIAAERAALLVGAPLVSVALAAVLSSRTALLIDYCTLMLAPQLLLATAWVALRLSVRRRAPAAALVGLVLLVDAGSLRGLAGYPKTNARDFARGFDAEVREGDLVVVHPGFLASSLNYYSRSGAEQIDFPQFGRSGLFRFDSLRSRAASPALNARLDRRLREAGAEARRVWLVSECRLLDFPRRTAPAATAAGSDPLVRSLERARRILRERHGPPATPDWARPAGPALESLCAERYGR
jgi:hypothetical protein